jgi:hypothetical protein
VAARNPQWSKNSDTAGGIVCEATVLFSGDSIHCIEVFISEDYFIQKTFEQIMGLFGRGAPAAEPVVEELHGFDLDRTKYRLDGIAHYGSIAALFMNAALVVMNTVPKTFDERKTENAAKLAAAALVCTTVVCGTYTTMVFSLLGLYSKAFLGMGKDDEFLEFFEKTSAIRDSGFVAFVVSLISFNLSFVATLYLHTEGRTRMWLTTGAFILFGLCAQNWFLIMGFAANLLPLSKYGFCV